MIFLYGNLIYWSSKRQNFVATSTCESKILCVCDYVAKVCYFKELVNEKEEIQLKLIGQF